MPDSTQHYFDLSLAEQAELLHGLAPVLGRRAEILEKDIWLCQALGVQHGYATLHSASSTD